MRGRSGGRRRTSRRPRLRDALVPAGGDTGAFGSGWKELGLQRGAGFACRASRCVPAWAPGADAPALTPKVAVRTSAGGGSRDDRAVRPGAGRHPICDGRRIRGFRERARSRQALVGD